MKRRDDMNMFEFLHEELKAEIFEKLPVKTLVRCTSVCKPWNFLIKDSAFIRNQSKITRSHAPLALCFRHYFNYELRVNQSDTHYVSLNNPDPEICRIQDFPLAHYSEHFWLTGSVNGLLCVVGDDYEEKSDELSRPQTLILWNPSIQKSMILPNPNLLFHTRCLVGFGYDSRSDDYKLLKMINFYDSAGFRSVAEVFSLNSGSWKIMDSRSIPHCEICYVPGSQAIVNGIIHWHFRKDKCNMLLGFNVTDETFQEIDMPEDLTSPSIDPLALDVLAYNDSTVGIVFRERQRNDVLNHLWIMKDYGVSSSWIKVFTMAGIGRRLYPWSRIGVSTLIGWFGQELFYSRDPENIIFGINLVNGQVRCHDFLSGKSCTFITSYVESLVLLNR
ncbi:putative F-box protein At3g16210 [Mercurialis annua]|uniref:putative F-box protein At3g16210 n=1 Tax=Mercurialis annua TaxID=3986 RepID=UPI00215E2750|nr:putative F-box protein At3g16210 [Mercurialis annua]